MEQDESECTVWFDRNCVGHLKLALRSNTSLTLTRSVDEALIMSHEVPPLIEDIGVLAMTIIHQRHLSSQPFSPILPLGKLSRC